MPSLAATPVCNSLIRNLPRRDQADLLHRCSQVDLDFGKVLCEPDQAQKYVYFPLTCFISLVAVVDDHPALEMGLIGHEGMLGATLVTGVATAPLRAVVQGPGTALRMTAGQLRSALRASTALRRGLNRYLYVLIAQLSQTAACTRFHEIEARLARWLLMTHDRAPADEFHLTHEYLADMLGVRRSGVTIAAGSLQDRKLISYSRGDIRILDRKGLESASCECYAAVIDDYTRQLA